jgi:hypothetical protein
MNPIREAMKNLPGHWYQGAFGDGRENQCGLGHCLTAIAHLSRTERCTVEEHRENVDKVFKLMNDVACEQYPRVVGFADFNDNVATSEEDVLRVMEKAAIKWDEQI